MGFTGSSCILLLLSQPFLHPFLRVSPSFLSFRFLRKEVIQPQVLLRLPCYDFTPVIDPTFDACFLAVRSAASGITNFHGVTGGVYKTRERIHRSMLIYDY